MPRPIVLVVDDHSAVRSLLERIVGSVGAAVVAEADGRQALRRARHERPDLVLIDMRLPGLDGPEVVSHLRRIKGLADVPIIGLSGYTHGAMRRRAIAAGCTAFFEKPFEVAALRSKLVELLAGAAVEAC
jgi:two-component system response regulator (stage 0 sporulation protein F)